MYAIKNTVQLVGCVFKKPVVRDFSNGRKVARFVIFIEDSYNNAKGIKVVDTQSHTLVAQGKVAAVAEKYLEKDTRVAIVGRLVNRHFRDSLGTRRSVTEVLVNELLILDMPFADDPEEYGVFCEGCSGFQERCW